VRSGKRPEQRSRTTTHNRLVLIAAVVTLGVFGGAAGLAALFKPAPIDQAAIARKIDLAVAEARLPENGGPLFIVASTRATIRDALAKVQAAALRDAPTEIKIDIPPPAVARVDSHRHRTHGRAADNHSRGLDAMAHASTNELIAEARKYLGRNPTGWARDWCGKFLDMVLKKTGHKGGGNLARGYIKYGTRLAGPEIGAIALFSRKGGGHVGIVPGVDANGNPIKISGIYNDRVAVATYPASRALAYVRPND
jgi:uncharacterized protein (TIGR02594 family)